MGEGSCENILSQSKVLGRPHLGVSACWAQLIAQRHRPPAFAPAARRPASRYSICMRRQLNERVDQNKHPSAALVLAADAWQKERPL